MADSTLRADLKDRLDAQAAYQKRFEIALRDGLKSIVSVA